MALCAGAASSKHVLSLSLAASATLPLLPLLPSPCREQRKREAELREFDELLRRREAFKQKGPPPPYS